MLTELVLCFSYTGGPCGFSEFSGYFIDYSRLGKGKPDCVVTFLPLSGTQLLREIRKVSRTKALFFLARNGACARGSFYYLWEARCGLRVRSVRAHHCLCYFTPTDSVDHCRRLHLGRLFAPISLSKTLGVLAIATRSLCNVLLRRVLPEPDGGLLQEHPGPWL